MKEMEKLELEERGLQIATAAQRIYPIGIDPRERKREPKTFTVRC